MWLDVECRTISRPRFPSFQWWRNGRIGGSKGTWHCNDFSGTPERKNPLLRSLAMSVVSASLCGTMAQASRHAEPPRPEFGRFGRSWARSLKGSCRLRAREGGGWAGSERFIQTGQPGRQKKDDRTIGIESPGPLERAPQGRSNGPKDSERIIGVLELTSNVTLCPT